MIGAGIFCGDLLIVDRALMPNHGNVVIAVVNGDLTVKRFHQESRRGQDCSRAAWCGLSAPGAMPSTAKELLCLSLSSSRRSLPTGPRSSQTQARSTGGSVFAGLHDH
nr:S24 family peptidase [Nodosilinea sp. LEGE 07298]